MSPAERPRRSGRAPLRPTASAPHDPTAPPAILPSLLSITLSLVVDRKAGAGQSNSSPCRAALTAISAASVLFVTFERPAKTCCILASAGLAAAHAWSMGFGVPALAEDDVNGVFAVDAGCWAVPHPTVPRAASPMADTSAMWRPGCVGICSGRSLVAAVSV